MRKSMFVAVLLARAATLAHAQDHSPHELERRLVDVGGADPDPFDRFERWWAHARLAGSDRLASFVLFQDSFPIGT